MPTAAVDRNAALATGAGAPRIALVGAPGDTGAAGPGASLAPAALRAAGLVEALSAAGHRVHDRGDLAGPAHPGAAAIAGHRHLGETLAWCRRVRAAVAGALEDDELPILLGGDHSLAIGSLAAVAAHCAAIERPLCVLWLDAHADFNTAATSPTGNLHGMALAAVCGEGHPDLLALGERVPMVDPRAVFALGVRAIDAFEQYNLAQRPVTIRGMREIRERGLAPALAEVLERAARAGAHLHLSLDLDFIDPTEAPGVGTPEPGGPSAAEALAAMDRVRETHLLGSLDVVEFDPGRDRDHRTAGLAVALIERLFDDQALARTG